MIYDYNIDQFEVFQFGIGGQTTGRLCEIIATFRYLGLMRGEALASMAELARRRLIGDDFDFEAEIERVSATLTPIRSVSTISTMGGMQLPIAPILAGLKR